MRRILMVLALMLVVVPSANAHVVFEKGHAASVKTCPVMFTVADYKAYAARVYKRGKISAKAHKRMAAMHLCLPSFNRRQSVGRLHRQFLQEREARRRPVITALMSCIIHHESRGNPLAQNGQYKGIAQWSPEAWARHGGHKYGPTPFDATYWEQVQVLASGIRGWGCRDWCPFDPC